MSDGSVCGQLLVKARFCFQATNEDELSFSKGDIICVTRQEEGGWWEGSLKGKTGWFPSNYVRELRGSGGCNFCQDSLYFSGVSSLTFTAVSHLFKVLILVVYKLKCSEINIKIKNETSFSCMHIFFLTKLYKQFYSLSSNKSNWQVGILQWCFYL